MERLTCRDKDGFPMMKKRNGFKQGGVERLAAYEDTGLEPEEVLPKDKADEIALKLMRLADLESLCSYTHLRELAEADKDGRLVVHGRWVSVAGKRDRICSRCLRNEPYKNADDDAEVFEFCPHCGAIMDGGDSDAVNQR